MTRTTRPPSADSKRPSRIARAIEDWFGKNQRPLPWRAGYEPYHVWISEVMAQQTRMDVVLIYFPRFIERFPTIEALAGANEADVVAVWSGLGYYRRARLLHRGAKEVMEMFGGRLPSSVEELRTIPGLGRYTAGAIASIAFERKAAIVDGNVARVVSRIDAMDAAWRSGALERAAWLLAERLVTEAKSPRALNQGLMELGASVCRPRSPLCGECPISKECRAFAQGDADAYPRGDAKKETVNLVVPLWVFEDREGRILFHRPQGRLMSGMLHLPHGNDLVLGTSMDVRLRGPMIGAFRHSVTHRRITFEVYGPTLPDALGDSRGDFLWVAPGEIGTHPHPSYVRKALRLWAMRGTGENEQRAPKKKRTRRRLE